MPLKDKTEEAAVRQWLWEITTVGPHEGETKEHQVFITAPSLKVVLDDLNLEPFEGAEITAITRRVPIMKHL